MINHTGSVNNDGGSTLATALPRYWCEICRLDLQSDTSLQMHRGGRKHCNREYRAGLRSAPFRHHGHTNEMYLPSLGEEEFFKNIVKGRYQNIVILTGAGISTAAGIPDFRTSGGGLFEVIKSKLEDDQHGFMLDTNHLKVLEPEQILSWAFYKAHPSTWQEQILPLLRQAIKLDDELEPTKAHRFCSYLAQQGWLKRIYTQNVDGLHTHESLCYTSGEGSPKEAEELVVECHGSLRRDDMVLFGDPLPRRFSKQLSMDFEHVSTDRTVDLLLVFGTSLRVAPVCAIPNLAPRFCHRVLITHSIGTATNHDTRGTPSIMPSTISIGKRKDITVKSFWNDRTKVRKKRWRQLLVDGDCDDFISRFCNSTGVQV